MSGTAEGLRSATKLLFSNMGKEELLYTLPVARGLRERGVAVEIFPDAAKLKKQFDYADRKAIPFLSINGENEMEQGIVQVKNLSTGEQKQFAKDDFDAIVGFLS